MGYGEVTTSTVDRLHANGCVRATHMASQFASAGTRTLFAVLVLGLIAGSAAWYIASRLRVVDPVALGEQLVHAHFLTGQLLEYSPFLALELCFGLAGGPTRRWWLKRRKIFLGAPEVGQE